MSWVGDDDALGFMLNALRREYGAVPQTREATLW
jgi:hypothetical protein